MGARSALVTIGILMLSGLALGQAPAQRLNPVIALLAQKKPVFGLYAPSAGRGNRGGAPTATAAPVNAGRPRQRRLGIRQE